MSNVVPMDSDMTTPHYKTSVGIGKMLSYVTNQSDGVQNNSVMMGSFTSLMIANTLTNLNTTANNLSITLARTMDGLGNSNASLTLVQSVSDAANAIYNTMTTYRQQDINFYTNSQAVMNDVQSTGDLTRLGQTETNLINNYIGTPKAISRINS